MIITTNLTTTAHYSEDMKKRYLLRKVWDESKPSLAVIMLVAGEASAIDLDNSTMFSINNASRLGYGSISILNLFAALGDYRLREAENEDTENVDFIVDEAKRCTAVVYAAGVGKATNKAFMLRQSQVLSALLPFEDKLFCLSDSNGNARFQHPLSPAVRTWYLSPMRASELVTDLPMTVTEKKLSQKKKKCD